ESDGKWSLRIYSLDTDSKQTSSAPKASFAGLDCASFLPEADFLVTREGGRLRVRDAFTGEVRRELRGEYQQTSALKISDDRRYLVGNLGADKVVLVDLVTGVEEARHSFGTGVAYFTLSPDSDVVFAVDHSGLVHIWNRRTGQSHVVTPDELERGRQVHVPVLSPDGKRMATATRVNPGGFQPMAIWDVESGTRLALLPSVDRQLNVPGFASNGRSLIVNNTRSPQLWHFDLPPDPPSPVGHKDEAWSAAYSPDGTILATGSDDTDEPETIK